MVTVNLPANASPSVTNTATVSGGGDFNPTNNIARDVTTITIPPTTPIITLVANAFGENPLIAPNTWVEIKGSNLAPARDSRIWQDAGFTNGQLPTQLDGVSVMVNGKSAFVYYISPTQVNILTIPDAISRPAQVQLTTANVTSSATVQGQPLSSSFFEFVSAAGKHYVYGRHLRDHPVWNAAPAVARGTGRRRHCQRPVCRLGIGGYLHCHFRCANQCAGRRTGSDGHIQGVEYSAQPLDHRTALGNYCWP